MLQSLVLLHLVCDSCDELPRERMVTVDVVSDRTVTDSGVGRF